MIYEPSSKRNLFSYNRLYNPDYVYDSLVYAHKLFKESSIITSLFSSNEEICNESFDNYCDICSEIAKSIRTHWEYIRRKTVTKLNTEFSDAIVKASYLRNEDGTVNKEKLISLIKRIEHTYSLKAPRIFMMDKYNLSEPDSKINELANMFKVYMDERYIKFVGNIPLSEAIKFFDSKDRRIYPIMELYNSSEIKLF